MVPVWHQASGDVPFFHISVPDVQMASEWKAIDNRGEVETGEMVSRAWAGRHRQGHTSANRFAYSWGGGRGAIRLMKALKNVLSESNFCLTAFAAGAKVRM